MRTILSTIVDPEFAAMVKEEAARRNTSISRLVKESLMTSLMTSKGEERNEKERSKGKVKKGEETTHSQARARDCVGVEFMPPMLTECEAYKAKHPALADTDVEAFYAYYTANGWTLSNGRPMRHWRAALVKWAKNDALKVFSRVATKESARDEKEQKERAEFRRNRLEAAKDPDAWQLCAERCANYSDGKCAKGAKWPPQFNDRPIPPQECKHFSSVDKNK